MDKNKPPLVGLTIRQRYDESIFLLRRNYSHAILCGGGIPVMIPASLSPENTDYLIERLDALVLTGGEDVNPVFYGMTPHSKLGTLDSKRDLFELDLCRKWLRSNKPLLGICRGMQLMNVAAGGLLHQDIHSEYPTAMLHSHQGPREDPTHPVEVKGDSLLSELLGSKGSLLVNSIHHQSISVVAPGFKIAAVAPDGIIEGIESSDGATILGVQWHPEEMVDSHPEQRRLFVKFIERISLTDSLNLGFGTLTNRAALDPR